MTDETITIVMSHDGSKYKLENIKMESTLNDLKNRITTHKPLIKHWGAPIAPPAQRLFYFGRELKSGSRTLAVLLGSYHSTFPKIMHLHSSQPRVKTVQLADDTSGDDDDDDDILDVTENINRNKRSSPSVALDVSHGNSRGSSKNIERNTNQVVVDLLDDSDSDDDVEIIDGPFMHTP